MHIFCPCPGSLISDDFLGAKNEATLQLRQAKDRKKEKLDLLVGTRERLDDALKDALRNTSGNGGQETVITE